MAFIIGVTIIIWISAMLGWWVITKYFRSADADKLKSRVMGTGPSAKSAGDSPKVALFEKEDKGKGKLTPQLMDKLNLNSKLKAYIEQAGMKTDPVRFVHICMGCFIGTYVLAVLLLPPTFRMYALVVAGLASWLPVMVLLRKRAARLKAFEEVFPDVLEFISRSMRAGHAFSVSLEMIHREFQEPLSTEFRRTFEEHNLGLPLEVALQSLSRRVPSLDVHFFVSAVLLQKRTGGNLAEILDKLAYVIRERFKLRGRIRAVSAHGKMTGMALTCIPIGVAIMMFFVNPDYVKFFFTDETGNIMFGAAVGFQILGYLIIRKIVSIEV
jgi:tight adherence protein B